jgi:hypothetical protein
VLCLLSYLVHLSCTAANQPSESGPRRCSVASNPWGNGVGYVPYDGVLLDAGTLPGSWYLGYNTGKNAVHEVGHWWVPVHILCNVSVCRSLAPAPVVCIAHINHHLDSAVNVIASVHNAGWGWGTFSQAGAQRQTMAVQTRRK